MVFYTFLAAVVEWVGGMGDTFHPSYVWHYVGDELFPGSFLDHYDLLLHTGTFICLKWMFCSLEVESRTA